MNTQDATAYGASSEFTNHLLTVSLWQCVMTSLLLKRKHVIRVISTSSSPRHIYMYIYTYIMIIGHLTGSNGSINLFC